MACTYHPLAPGTDLLRLTMHTRPNLMCSTRFWHGEGMGLGRLNAVEKHSPRRDDDGCSRLLQLLPAHPYRCQSLSKGVSTLLEAHMTGEMTAGGRAVGLVQGLAHRPGEAQRGAGPSFLSLARAQEGRGRVYLPPGALGRGRCTHRRRCRPLRCTPQPLL